jgi:hypothetical protein
MSSIEEIVEDTDITQSTTESQSTNDDKKVLTWPKRISLGRKWSFYNEY